MTDAFKLPDALTRRAFWCWKEGMSVTKQEEHLVTDVERGRDHLAALVKESGRIGGLVDVASVAPSFSFDYCGRLMNREVLLERGVRDSYEEAEIRELWKVSDDHRCVFVMTFEYVEPVTALRHREVWVACYQNDLLQSIVSTASALLPW